MNDIEQGLTNFNDLRFRKLTGPTTCIHISSHSVDRSYAVQCLQDVRPADVTGMNDEVHTFKGLDPLTSQMTMGIRDDPNKLVEVSGPILCSSRPSRPL